MVDEYNRNIDYIRISITDRCNLRCVYCMPEDGVSYIPHHEILTYEEIIRLCFCFAQLGIHKVKLTGGEPLVRKGFPYLLKQIKAIEGIDNVTLTTNGVLLEEQLDSLVDAGIDGINVSLDTLDPKEYERLTRYDQLNKVMRGINKVLKHPSINLKINCVPVPSTNLNDSIMSLVSLARNNKLSVRFIELMPIGLGKELEGYSEVSIKQMIERKYGALSPYDKVLGNGPCIYYSLEGFQGKVGFISAMSHKFCNQCNRIRLTSEGYLKNCLHFSNGIDLKAIMRNGISDNELTDVMYQTILMKPKEHQFNVNTNKNSLTESKNSTDYQELMNKNHVLEEVKKESNTSPLENKQMSQIGG